MARNWLLQVARIRWSTEKLLRYSTCPERTEESVCHWKYADRRTDAGLRDYFKSTWINVAFSPHMWTHFDHMGHTDDKYGRGFHESCSACLCLTHRWECSWTGCRNVSHYEVQCRIVAVRLPKKQKSVYERLDSDIQAAGQVTVWNSRWHSVSQRRSKQHIMDSFISTAAWILASSWLLNRRMDVTQKGYIMNYCSWCNSLTKLNWQIGLLNLL